MAVTESAVSLTDEDLSRIQQLLGELGLDGWFLYDFRGVNSVATGVLGLPALTRRFAVLIPIEGAPIAVTHRIEQQPWRDWIGVNRPYLNWEEFEGEIRRVLTGRGVVALEYSGNDAVPYLDRVPAGVMDLIRSTGVRVRSSGDLVSAIYSRWSAEGVASHDRAAALLREAAFSAFDLIGQRLGRGDRITEWEIREWIRSHLIEQGLTVGVDAVVAVNANAANPHYAPGAAAHDPIGVGDLVLIDLWGKETAEAIYADQTWMAFVGAAVPEPIVTAWAAIRDAREAAVELIRSRHRSGRPVAGSEVDDAARKVVAERGLASAFIHRTGHSIDRELHGSGPNIDNLETRETRRLIPGIGFSIEPGVYLPGEFGLRTEINVYMAPEGPRITTPDRQDTIHLIDGTL